jgi:putative iron-regulated protein
LAGAAVLVASLILFGGGRPRPGFDPALAKAAVEGYAGLLHAMYADSVSLAEALREAVAAFAARPTAEALESCRRAWLRARPSYLQTEVGRFYEGPVDGGPDAPEKFLNAWPLDEAYIDYVEGAPRAGLINDPAGFPKIDRSTLRSANEKGGEANVATGWHAIEFLLWGQDLRPGPGGGRRSHLDYVPGGGTAAHEERRRDYLRACADMLVEDLAFLRDQWAPADPNNYRTWLLGLEPRGALAKILTGVATLAAGELRGERLVVPYTTKDREDEHSCFSDTTHLDHLNDMIGIRNVWEGRFASSGGRFDFSGAGLRELARAADPVLAGRVGACLASCLEALRDPRLDPFETAIQGVDTDAGRAAVREAIRRLAEFEVAFCDLARRLDVPVNTQLLKRP